jgi:large subunit ribosomal protein L4
MELEVLNQNGSGDSKVSLADNVFNQEFNQDLVHQLVNTYIHNSHQRTKGQKNRSAVRGGGKKPWKQKGTGRARAGTIRSPIWRGGGMTFAHTYSDIKPKKINKKMYRSAMRSIWSKLAEEKRLVAVNDLKIDEPVKSSQVKTILADLGLNTALIVLSSSNDNLKKASKNLTQCKVQTISSIDPSALIQAEKVVVTSATLEKLTEVLS